MKDRNPAPRQETPLDYAETTDDTYSETAAKTFTATEPAGGTLILRGPCPRCHAVIDIPVVTSIFRSSRSLGDWLRVPAPKVSQAGYEEPMMCTCQDEHPNRPEGRSGCGAYWLLTISSPAQ